MNKKYTMSVVGAILVQSVLMSGAEPLGPRPPDGGCGLPGPGGEPSVRCLVDQAKHAGAGDEQIQALSVLLFEQRAKSIDLRAAMEKAELALERLIMASAPDDAAVGEALDAVNEARGSLFKSEVMAGLKVRRILGDALMRKMRPPMPAFGPGRGGFKSPPATERQDEQELVAEP